MLLLCWLVMAAIGRTARAAALPLPPRLGISHTIHATSAFAMVGAIFRGNVSDGDHFCTASVVDSPGQDLIITAAHCLDGGTRGLSFVPGYHDGQAPYGVWPLSTRTVDPRWTKGHSEDLDVAFAAVPPMGGRRIQTVVGGYQLSSKVSTTSLVHITGYPDSGNAPITCANRITAFGSRQLRIYCTDFTGGTSGSPWVTDGDTVMGVIGGYQEGGNTPDISYSPYFGDAVQALYRRAIRRRMGRSAGQRPR
ncbi:trypsin-like serine peptidase [Streptomyces silvisoli]|uniref:Trypsin-like peptidase domain-containing protein n=1 Tax=Streptomyces silvisoli TaxID=3034235 RepID=A0ABT5ZP54_9ACTN|nr:trypsin-like peptidase domain-containing protein [Streptomyces silvisoli]MDF3291612.1 trypsin-like peptidase domain-containing protein [Streptomyces silvisoli]